MGNLIPCPYLWPRYLSRKEASRYVGVPSEVFDAEVQEGLWAQPRRRGKDGNILTWDRCDLDSAADLASGWETLSIASLWGVRWTPFVGQESG